MCDIGSYIYQMEDYVHTYHRIAYIYMYHTEGDIYHI